MHDAEHRINLLLADLSSGAAAREDVMAYLDGEEELTDLLAMGMIAEVSTKLGMVYILGPRGKKHLGIHSSWITRPDAALDQVLSRRVREKLEASGWRLDNPGSLPYPRYLRPDGRPAYVLVSSTGPRARSLRRLLEQYRTCLLREGAVLVVCTVRWKSLCRVADGSNGLVEVRPLELSTMGLPPPSPRAGVLLSTAQPSQGRGFPTPAAHITSETFPPSS